MKDVLFICKANVGRSQIAEAYYNHFIGKELAISAGIKNYIEKYEGKPSKAIVDLMKKDGIDMSSQKIKLLTEEMLNQVGMIVVLCDRSLCPDYLLKQSRVIYKNIDDPYGRSERTTLAVRDQIKEIAIGLLNNKA